MGCWRTQKIRAAISSVSNTAVLYSTFNSQCFQSHCLFWSAVPSLSTAPSIPTDICVSPLCECPLRVPFSLLWVTFFFPYLTQLLLIPQTQRKWYFIYLTTTCHMLLYLPGSGTMGINKFHFPSSWTFQLLWSLSWLVKYVLSVCPSIMSVSFSLRGKMSMSWCSWTYIAFGVKVERMLRGVC